MTYESSILNRDLDHKNVKITRSNVEKEGYLSFLLPLLENNTYSLIIDMNDMKRPVNDGWVDLGLRTMMSETNSIYSCGTYSNAEVALGCLFVPSLQLRTLWTKTELRVNDERAMNRLCQSFQCKYHSKLLTHNINTSQKSFTGKVYSRSTCIQELDIDDMMCNSKHQNDGSVSLYFSLYKRNLLMKQMEQITNSTISINEFIIYQGEMHQNYKEVKERYPFLKHLWTTNWNNPFFLRFMVPLLLRSYIIYNIDDDVYVGKNTLKSMMNVVVEDDAVTAFFGRKITKLVYNPSIFEQSGISQNNKKTVVDFLVVSYCLKLEYAKVFWRYRGMMIRNGEDIHLSMTNHLECNRNSIIPQIISDSRPRVIPDKLGTSLLKDHYINRGALLRTWILLGYQPINNNTLVHYPKFSNQMKSYYEARLRYSLVSFNHMHSITTIIIDRSTFLNEIEREVNSLIVTKHCCLCCLLNRTDP